MIMKHILHVCYLSQDCYKTGVDQGAVYGHSLFTIYISEEGYSPVYLILHGKTTFCIMMDFLYGDSSVRVCFVLFYYRLRNFLFFFSLI